MQTLGRTLSRRTFLAAMQDFTALRVWNDAHALTLHVYRLSQHFPSEERYGLTAQLRRSAASIAANVAEGCGRGSDADFARFVQVALGSCTETRYHVRLAFDLDFLGADVHARLEADVLRVGAQLTRLRHTLRA